MENIELKRFWEQIKEELIGTLPENVHPWIYPLEISGYDKGVLTVVTGQMMGRDLLRRNHYEQMNQAGCALAFHIGSDFFDFTHPSRAQRIAEHFPTMPVMLVHMGGAGKPDLSNACIDVAKVCPNVMLTGSAVSYLSIIHAIKELGPERVCFGSDAPFALPHVERAAYEAFLPDVTDAAGAELIMCKNAMKFFQYN